MARINYDAAVCCGKVDLGDIKSTHCDILPKAKAVSIRADTMAGDRYGAVLLTLSRQELDMMIDALNEARRFYDMVLGAMQ